MACSKLKGGGLSAKAKGVMQTQYVSFVCDRCSKRVGCNISHYGLMECMCGKEWWALQPKRGGPLVAFPWPGLLVPQRIAA